MNREQFVKEMVRISGLSGEPSLSDVAETIQQLDDNARRETEKAENAERRVFEIVHTHDESDAVMRRVLGAGAAEPTLDAAKRCASDADTASATLLSIRALVDARPDETTVDAVKRVLETLTHEVKLRQIR